LDAAQGLGMVDLGDGAEADHVVEAAAEFGDVIHAAMFAAARA